VLEKSKGKNKTIMFKLNIIVLFLPLDFSNTVFWGQDFFCVISHGEG